MKGGGARGQTSLYESIASVPEESLLLGGGGSVGGADIVEESLHFEKSTTKVREETEGGDDYSENFESLQESHSFLR